MECGRRLALGAPYLRAVTSGGLAVVCTWWVGLTNRRSPRLNECNTSASNDVTASPECKDCSDRELEKS